MVKLTKEEIYLFAALLMSYGFYIDSSRQNEAERMKRLMDLFLFETANVRWGGPFFIGVYGEQKTQFPFCRKNRSEQRKS